MREVLKSNTICAIDIGGGKHADFEFHPQGLVIITTEYEDGTDTITEVLRVEKSVPWSNDVRCEEVKKLKTIQADSIDSVKIPFTITVLPENSIEVFAHEVKKEVNEKLKVYADTKLTEEQVECVKTCTIDYDYLSRTNTLTFTCKSTNIHTRIQMRFVPIDDRYQSEAQTFYSILNQVDYDVIPTYARSIKYENVWNREDFYVHASFMNLTQYNQLGRTGEIYPKPTKLTKYTQNIPDIEFWTSLNGVDPFILVDQDFDVALALAATLNNADITF